eukprot:TRINITY_DN3241_c0_g1_i1.p1 TRINITY_DN3241_c0_g1~~TRINITY_DN3241_c0_g1_i1.p1  ORF type:complete len:315 (-),score=67.61 TRINITY_DN3241_c0_g1_i1:237-1181(-)
MQVICYSSISSLEQFRQEACDFLFGTPEAESMSIGIIGVLYGFGKDPSVAETEFKHFLKVEQDAELQLLAVVHCSHNEFTLTLSRGSKKVNEELGRYLLDMNVVPSLKVINGTAASAQWITQFLNEHVASAGEFSPTGVNDGVNEYVCWRVKEQTAGKETEGSAVLAREEDISLLIAWKMAYMKDEEGYSEEECPEILASSEEELVNAFKLDELYVWKVETPEGPRLVSQAVLERMTKSLDHINFVFTPPEFRKKGYSTSLVRALARKSIDSGRFAWLSTGEENSANNVYRAVGFEVLIGGWDRFVWKDKDPVS